uniref:Calponin-homology (CH) domain-containing protein n=1 Tax=Globisporangium ultimum (strain ATCC 200006 / CBS 805.95 / DAOM BR144) TaxID=431595 RepID=K3XBN9_GLOUD
MDADLTLAWVRAEIAPLAAKLQPPLPDANSTWSICEFLRDGRALCLLSAALDHVATKQQNDDDDAHDIGDSTLPKNLQRSLHQLSTFHALERIQYFIKWCRNAPLDAYLVFSSVQLLDELNEKIVCTCLNALRDKFRPELRAKYNDLMAAKAAAASDHAEVVADKKAADDAAAADPAVVSDEDDDANETKAKDNNAEAEEEHDIPATPVKATRLTSAPSTPLSQPKSANKLSAFLSKFPSETNVLTTVETAVEVAVDAPKVPEEVVEEHDDDDEEVHEYDHNDEIHEKVVDNEVEAVEKDESVAEEIGQVAAEKPLEDSDDEDFEEPSLEEESSQDQTQPRYTSAFSPRSSISSSKRSSRVSTSEDPSFEPRFSESQETKIGLPCDSQEPATSDDSAAAQESFEKVSAENVEIEDSDNSDDDAVRDQFADERLSDDLFSEQIPQESSSETVALGAEVHAVSEELLGDYVEVEQHNFDNHDHADGEQPFFVVEEVSLSKPSANSKLFAFLSSVDSAHPHPSSHTSEADEAEKADSVGSAPSRHSGSRKSALSPKRSVEDASEHSERSVRTSMTAISLAVSSEVILEKERLSGENLALSQKLKTVEESLSAKESEFASLKAELEALKHQLAAEQANSEAKLKTVVEEHETLVSKIRADHLKEITATRAAAHDDALVEKQNQNYDLKIAALEEQNKALEQQLQIAKDSEEAARYSAQLAFAVRDEAETLLRSQ